jgi:hypothetical protein
MMSRIFLAAAAASVQIVALASAQQQAGTVKIDGEFLDRYTGEPLPAVVLKLGSKTATADQAGRFVVEDSPRKARLTAVVPGGRVIFRNPRMKFEVKDTYGYEDNPVSADWSYVEIDSRDGAPLSLGAIFADGGPRYADARFAGVCDGAAMTSQPLQTLLFMKNRRDNTPWNHQPILTDNISKAFKRALRAPDGTQPPRGVLCVNAREDSVGSYTNFGVAYRKTWETTLVRYPDGKTFKKTLRTLPPAQIRSIPGGGGSTDPFPLLIEWLKTVGS